VGETDLLALPTGGIEVYPPLRVGLHLEVAGMLDLPYQGQYYAVRSRGAALAGPGTRNGPSEWQLTRAQPSKEGYAPCRA